MFVAQINFAQTKIAELNFETAGGYTTNPIEFGNGNSIYLTRTDGSNIMLGVPSFTNVQGSYYFAAQNVDGQPDNTNPLPQYLNLDDVNISGYTNLEFRVHLAESSLGGENWDANFFSDDFVRFRYDIDNTGAFINLLWVEGASGLFGNEEPRIDDDFNSTGEGTEITDNFTQFIRSITGIGSLLDIQIEISLDKQYEDIAIDNIEIWGVGAGCTTTTTWNGTIWDNGNPNNTVNAIINDNYDSSTDGGSFDACNLVVNTGFNLDIQGTDYIQVENDITINGTIIIATEASLIQVDDSGAVTVNAGGDGVLQKTTTTLTHWYDYTYWSSPISNETIGSVFGLVPADRIFEYDAANFEDVDNNGFDDNANDWSIASGIMTSGRGYAAVAENNVFPFPQTNTMTFNGQFNNGVITPVVTMSPGPNPLNWNFLGNPYPSPINANLFLGNPLNVGVIGGTLYFWTHNSPPDEANPGNEGQNFSVDDYASYNSGTGGIAAVSGGVTPTGIIATGQGFFIEGLSAGVATFNNSMRVNNGNNSFYKTSDRIWLNFKNDFGAFSQILIGFNEQATNGFDRLYDSKRLDAGSYVSFFSFIEEEKYAIQSKSEVTEEEIIPLGIMSTIENETEFSISIDNIEGVIQTSEVYLYDYYLNVEHDLNQEDYKFTTINGEFNDRFALSLKTNLNVIDMSLENVLIFGKNENEIMLSTIHQSIITNVKIFDMLGRLLLNIDYDNETTTANFDATELRNSVFIARVTLDNGNVLTKKGLH